MVDDPRTGKVVQEEHASWTACANNPGAVATEW